VFPDRPADYRLRAVDSGGRDGCAGNSEVRMKIQGLDFSHWQGKLTIEGVGRMIGAGVRYLYVKATQGAGYIDDAFEHNVMMLQNTGLALGAYHFVTNEDAGKQWANFKKQLVKFTWQLPPALDCEAFTSVVGEIYSVRELQMYPTTLAAVTIARDIMGIDDGRLKAVVSPDGDTLGVYTSYALSYPSEAIIDAIGRQATIWMATQPTLKDYVYPAIYTNCGSGNKIFKTKAMARYLLWVANWNVDAPCIPNVWKGVPYYIWQDYVERDGTIYGLPPNTPVDHDVWGPLLPFPSEPTPPPVNDYEMTLKQNGTIYAGTLEVKA